MKTHPGETFCPFYGDACSGKCICIVTTPHPGYLPDFTCDHPLLVLPGLQGAMDDIEGALGVIANNIPRT